MKVYFDASAIYEWLRKDVVGGPESKMLSKGEEESPMEQHRAAYGSKDNGTLVSRQFVIPSVPLPLPFGSLDGFFVSIGDKYSAHVDINNPCISCDQPQTTRIIVPARYRIETLLECLGAVPDSLKTKYGRDYIQLGQGSEGYVLEKGRGIDREVFMVVLSGRGFTRLKIGGTGAKVRKLDGLEDFTIDIGRLAEAANTVINCGLEEAVRKRLVDSTFPNLKVRLGPVA